MAKALKDVREIAEKLNGHDYLNREDANKLETQQKSLNDKLDAHQELSNELVAKTKAQEEAIKSYEVKMDILEKQLCNMGTGNPDYQQKSKSLHALENYIQQINGGKLSADTKSYLRTDNNPQGGFLVTPADYENEILKPIELLSPIRQLAKKRRINTLEAKSVVRATNVEVYWKGEGEKGNSYTPTYGEVTIPVKSQFARVLLTNELLYDSMFDIRNEVMTDINEQFAVKEGEAFVNGTGVNSPIGYMSPQAKVARRESGGAGTFNGDDLIQMAADIKTGYKPVYGASKPVMAYLRTLKATGSGQYLFDQGNLAAGTPNVVNGYPLIEIADMSNTVSFATGQEPVVFADFSKMYEVIDSFQAIITNNPYSLSDQGMFVLTIQRFVGGNVIMPEAGVILKIK